ncbi:MAG: amidohydrolase family protein [Opitutales bacterium]
MHHLFVILLAVAITTLPLATVQALTAVRSDGILTLAAGDDRQVDGYLLFDDHGILTAVAEGAPPAGVTRVIDARGKLVMPGFVSGHNHLWQSAFRGIAAGEELYGWLQDLHWTYGEHFQDGDMYAFTLHGALDQLAHGITTTLNHSQNIAPTYAHYLEQFEAEMDAGQHFIFSYILDKDATSPEERKAKLLALMEETEAVPQPHPCLGFGIHGVGIHRSPELLAEEAALAKELGFDMQIHYLEEKEQSLKKGQDDFPGIVEAGALWDGLVYAHFIHVPDAILQASIEAGAKMIWNPLSNGRLASGLADIPRYQESGLAVGMGVDGAASADLADPFQNMRTGMYALRMRDAEASVMMPRQILGMHTLDTARVLEVNDRVGSLEVGKYADFLIIDPSEPATGPINDPFATLVFSCDSSNIDQVWVRGELLVVDGKAVHHDPAAIGREVAERVARIKTAAEAGAGDS